MASNTTVIRVFSPPPPPNPPNPPHHDPAFPDDVLVSLIDILHHDHGNATILALTTAAPQHREYGVKKVLSNRMVRLRTARQVVSFCHFILSAPHKRGYRVNSISLSIPAFEDPQDAELLEKTIPWLSLLRVLNINDPEPGLAAQPQLIEVFRNLRFVTHLYVSGAGEWTHCLLGCMRTNLETIYICRRGAEPQPHRPFSMSFVLWRYARSLRELFVDSGLATSLEDDDYALLPYGAHNDVLPLRDDYESDFESEGSDVNSLVAPNDDELSGLSSGYTSDTYADDDVPVLNGELITKLLTIGGAVEGMNNLEAIPHDSEGGDAAGGCVNQDQVGEGSLSDVTEDDLSSNGIDYEDRESVASDLNEVGWKDEAGHSIAIFPKLRILTAPNLVRETYDHLMLAAPALTSLDVGARCSTYTRGMHHIRQGNQAATFPRLLEGESDWADLQQVRGGLIDLAIMGNATTTGALEIIGVVTKHQRLLPVVVDDLSAKVLRVSLALPFRVRMLSPRNNIAPMLDSVKALTLRTVIKTDTHRKALESSLLRVLREFGALRRVIVDLTYDEDDVHGTGCLDNVDFHELAENIAETSKDHRKTLKRIVLKRGSRVECWRVRRIRTNGVDELSLSEVPLEVGKAKVEKKGMVSDAFPL